jgi:hypothetical protein
LRAVRARSFFLFISILHAPRRPSPARAVEILSRFPAELDAVAVDARCGRRLQHRRQGDARRYEAARERDLQRVLEELASNLRDTKKANGPVSDA